ncbi:HAD-IA family hydrolase [Candidatus Peregrinibacteria bacterium]|nr:HAD-IA family hydrolase [Candidatus Peregrinibacteria bacterium]
MICNKKIKGIILDLDGTIAFSQHYHYLAIKKVVKKQLKLDYTEKQDAKYFTGHGSNKTFQKISKRNKLNLDEKTIKKLVTLKRRTYLEIVKKSKIKPVPGILEFVQGQLNMGRKIIVATNNRVKPTKIILHKTGLSKLIQDIITMEDVKEKKPAPDTFKLALKKLKLKPNQAIVFEDSAQGVKAAKAANIYCYGLTTSTTKRKLQNAGADEIIKNYKNLLCQKKPQPEKKQTQKK